MAEVRTVIGLMSGTSMDGVDVALLRTDGTKIVEFGPFETFHYTDQDRAVVARAVAAARSSPARIRSRVLLPLPEGPTRTRRWPGWTSRSTSRNAVVDPKRLVI